MTYKRRTDEEWIGIIQTCKSSGYSDIEWCQQNNISISTFYYKLNILREKASLNELPKAIVPDEQQVVQVNLKDELPTSFQATNDEVALRLNINGIAIDVLNSASQRTIENTLLSLRSLC